MTIAAFRRIFYISEFLEKFQFRQFFNKKKEFRKEKSSNIFFSTATAPIDLIAQYYDVFIYDSELLKKMKSSVKYVWIRNNFCKLLSVLTNFQCAAFLPHFLNLPHFCHIFGLKNGEMSQLGDLESAHLKNSLKFHLI